MRAVATADPAYRIAVAELPGRVVAGDGDIRVVDGVLEADGTTVVDRLWLRQDVVADVGRAPARSVLVECAAGPDDTGELLRDAVGWARELAGGPLGLVETRSTARGILASLRGARCSATVLLARREAGPSWLRVLAIDAVRTEVIIEHPGAVATVETTGADGVRRAPARYESAQRLALRRLLDALEAGGHPADLADLAHDTALAAGINDSDMRDSQPPIP